MGRMLKGRTVLKLAVAAGAVFVVVISIGSLGAGAHTIAHAAKTKAYSTSVTYVSTTPGRQSGGSTLDIQGHGAFSAKLGSSAHLIAAVASVITGVPITEIVRGGTYKERESLVNSRTDGVIVAQFKAHGLGTACLTYSAKGAPYNPSLGYVVMSGTIKLVGGTGAATRWRGSATFTQDGIGSSTIEQLFFHGAIKASVGKARGMTGACKQVAKQKA